MQVIRKGTTPNGTDIRIEDWSETYPGTFKKNATIGFYPMAIHDIYDEENPQFPAYPKRGETFRASLNFDTEMEALEAFVLLENGCREFTDYMDNYSGNVISKENFLEAIAR